MQKQISRACLEMSIPKSCPNDYFFSGPRSSVLKFKVGIDPIRVKGHEMSMFAKLGLKEFKDTNLSNHEKVQNFLMLHDAKTIAVELPLWIENEEKLPLVEGNLTGHIDIIRVEDNKIWIWDYKPNAIKEKYASTQIFFYALMLKQRIGIPLENIRCAYFDGEEAFMFKPEDVRLDSRLNTHNP